MEAAAARIIADHSDHRHFGARQRPYSFTSPDQLMADFTVDIARWNHENGRS
jgi:hypothetical protein